MPAKTIDSSNNPDSDTRGLNIPEEINTLPEDPRPTPLHWQQVAREHLASVEQWLKAPSKKTRKHDLYLDPREIRAPADAAVQIVRGRQADKKRPAE